MIKEKIKKIFPTSPNGGTPSSQTFSVSLQCLCEAFPAQSVILDDSGNIAAVNSQWRHFADTHNFPMKNYGIGENYIEMCETTLGMGENDASRVLEGLEEVLTKKRERFSIKSSWHRRNDQNCFTLHITRLETERSVCLVVVHEAPAGTTQALEGSQEVMWEALQALDESTPGFVFCKNLEGRYQYVNRQFEQIFHLDRKNILGKKDYDVFPLTQARVFRAHDQEVMESLTQMKFEETVREDGNSYTFQVTKFPLYSDKGELYGLGGVSLELSEGKEEKAFKDLQNTVLEKIISGLPIKSIFDFLCLQVEQLIPGSLCSIMKLDQSIGCLNVVSAPTAPPKLFGALDGLIAGEHAGSCGTAAHTGETVIVENTATDKRWCGLQNLATEFGMNACWSIPIFSQGKRVIGTFAISHFKPCAPTLFQRHVLERVSHLAGLAIARRGYEASLEENEKRYRDLYDAAPLAYVTATPQGIIQMVNSRMCELTGLLKEDLLGRPVVDLFSSTENGKDKAVRLQETSLKGLGYQGEELELRRADQNSVWCRGTMRLIYDDEGRIVAQRVILEDFSKQKRADERIRLLTFCMDKAAEAIFTVDVCGRFVEVNQTAYQKLGYTQEEIRRMSLVDIDTGYSHDQWSEHWKTLQEEGHAESESVYRMKNGKTCQVEVLGKHLAFEGNDYGLFFVRDITKRKEEALELEKRERLLQLMLETGPGCIKRVAADGTLLHMNSAGLNLIEAHTEEDALGRCVFDLVLPDHRSAFEQMHQHVMEGKSGTLQFKIQGMQGTERWMETYATPFNNPITNQIEHLAVTHDITERKRKEKFFNRNGRAIRELHLVTSSPNLTFKQQLQSILQLGCQRFGLELGIMTRVQGELLEVMAVAGEEQGITKGAFIPICEAYCGVVVERKEPVSFERASGTEFKDHPLFKALRLEAYIGTPIMVRDELYGTLCFTSQPSLSENFTEEDKDFIQLIARWVGREVEREQADEALKFSEERFRRIFEDSSTGMTICDPQGSVLKANPAFCQLTGYSEEELVGNTYAQFTYSDDVQNNLHLTQELFAGSRQTYSLEKRYVRKDGHLIWVNVTASLLRNQPDQGSTLLALIEDITERKHTEKVLRHIVEGVASGTEKEFFRRLVQQLAQALDFDYTFIGLLTDDKEHIGTLAVWANGRLIDNVVYPLEGSPCKNVLSQSFRFYPTGLQQIFSEDPLLVEMDVDSYVGIALANSEGETIGLMAGLNKTSMKGIEQVKEIFQICASRVAGELERLKAESARQDSERRVQAILDSSTSVIYVKDLEGRYQMINRQYEELFNVKREEVKGLTDFDLFPSDIAEKFQKNDRDVATKKGPSTIEEIAPHPDGLHTYVSNKFPFMTQEGVPYAVCGISTDITERKRAEEALKEMNIALRHAMPGISTLDQNGLYVQVNSHYASMLGCEPQDLIGTSWEPTVMPEDLPQVYKAYEEMQQTGKGEFEARGIRKDGSIFFKHGLMVKGTEGHHCFMRDISERKSREALVAAIHQAESEFITSADSGKIFHALLENILALTNSEYGFIGEVLYTEKNQPYLKTQAISDNAWNEEIRTRFDQNAPYFEFFNMNNLFGQVILTKKPVMANDPSHDDRTGGVPPWHPPIHAFFGLPFFHGERLVGMVGMANRRGGYDEALLQFLQPLLTSCGTLLNAYQNFTLREKAEQELKKREQELREALGVQTQISQDLHDHILQSLYAVGLILSAAKKPLQANQPDKATNYIEQSIQQLNQAIVEIREFIESLLHQRPGDVDLITKVKVLVARMNVPHSLVFSEQIDQEAVGQLRNEQKVHLLNIIREAVRNAFQHAQATEGVISLVRENHQICLMVKDNGIGFDVNHVSQEGHGLENIQDRTEKLGGTLCITSSPNAGTTIKIELEVEKKFHER